VPDYRVPRDKRAQIKVMIGELRRARGWSVEQLASHPSVRISPKMLQEYERPGGRCPSRVLVAALGYALEAPELAQALLPPGWRISRDEPRRD
jgi:transcriptional regulator with XRE-family HTH domain